MEINPLISVIMSTFNCAQYLDESIQSILNQTFKNFEFIIIDDGSTDNSDSIIQKYCNIDIRVIYIKNKKNIGIAAARNKGMALAKGKYIAIMDADDIALENRFEVELSYLEKNPNIFLVGSSVIIIDDKGKKTGIIQVEAKIDEINKLLPKINPFLINTILFRNEIGIKFRDKFFYCEDYDFYLNLFTLGKILVNLSDILVKYRKYSNSVTASKKAKVALFFKKAREFYNERLQSNQDKYDEFDPNSILSIDTRNSTDSEILTYEIIGNFQNKNIPELHFFTSKYKELFGLWNKNIFYHFASFNRMTYKIAEVFLKILSVFQLENRLKREV